MTQNAYFIDTSYLLEFYGIPGRSQQHAISEIRGRFQAAWEAEHLLFLPAVCVLELGNTIAQLTNPADRQRFAVLLEDDVKTALSASKMRKFTVLEAPELPLLPTLLDSWRKNHVHAPRGLVDAALADRAAAFKKQRSEIIAVRVHIWTRDRKLKAVEPDAEEGAFV